MTSQLTLAAALTVLLMAGCGGGSSSSSSVDPSQPAADDPGSVPASAAASTQALIQYQQALDPDDRAEPKALPPVAMPLDDTAEPAQLG